MAKVRFVGDNLNRVIDIKVGDLILEQALKNGLEIPYGCRYGSCYACAVEVIKGMENIECPGLKPSQSKKGPILCCISRIKKNGDVTLKV